ncbi:AAA family ATPase [Paenibacillus sp. SGZ-1009]|uniref:AAA family ATPase n=1 Tax=Paenibacillus campi TaxID=3106031 RepID=UPI002AFF3ED1|nr:AAA family ATPase [Paenibacillus sp. SGZ-1009]
MVKGSTRRHKNHVVDFKSVSVLKFSALYGANAAGKSNLVKAIKFSRNIIVDSLDKSITFDKYCKIDCGNQEKSSQFEYEILINGIVYAYGFAIHLLEKKVEKEWLYSLEDEQETELFTRAWNGEHYELKINYAELNLEKDDEMRLKVYAADLSNFPTTLLITELNKNKKTFEVTGKISILNAIYDWFEEKLEVIAPNESLAESGITFMDQDKALALSHFLEEFGTGITEVCTKKIHEKELYKELPQMIVKRILDRFNEYTSDKNEKSKHSKRKHLFIRTPYNIHQIEKLGDKIQIQTLTFKHADDDGFYTLGEESDGTIRLVDIYDILASESEKVFVVDEIDRSLHPNLTFNFVKKYLNKNTISQLIVTTHEDRLLDLDMLRRDEIWFVEKQDNNESRLYSLEKYKERFDRDILRAYLDGRYGSVPKFKFF